jgi:hypothetical protein
MRDAMKRVGHKGMEHGLEADPVFMDPDKGDFRLADGSPCRGAASDGGDLGADGALMLDIMAGRFNGPAWLKSRFVRHFLSRAKKALGAKKRSREEKQKAARSILKKAAALDPENESVLALREKIENLSRGK